MISSVGTPPARWSQWRKVGESPSLHISRLAAEALVTVYTMTCDVKLKMCFCTTVVPHLCIIRKLTVVLKDVNLHDVCELVIVNLQPKP